MTTIDNRETVASFPTYGEAERAVGYLSDHAFPVERTMIVGRDLRVIEQVTGPLTWSGSVLRGMGGGALTGVLIGWIFGLFNWLDPVVASIVLAFDGLVFGAIVGGLFGLLTYLAQRGRRDFTSVRAVLPGRYDVLTDPELAPNARNLLAQFSAQFASHGARA